MTITSFRGFPDYNKVALFDDAPGGGDHDDINSPRNRPALNPEQWLENIYFHSDLDNLEVVSDTTVAISHASTSGATTGGLSSSSSQGGGGSQNAASLKYRASSAEHVLVTHGLGYAPICAVVVGSNVLFPGMPVQTQSDGRGRYCSAYATTTQIKLYEWTSVSSVALPAASVNYRVIVFRAPRSPSGDLLFSCDPATGKITMAKGRFDSTRRYLQVVPGGSPFGVAYGKTMQLRNGAPRFVNPNGSVFEPVPAALKGRWVCSYVGGTYTGAYGSSMAYNGTFTGPEQILVQAP